MFNALLTQNVASHLWRFGFAVVPNVVEIDVCRKFKNEILRLHQEQRLAPNSTQLVHKNQITHLYKPHIFETDSTNQNWIEMESKIPTLTQLLEDQTHLTMLSVLLPRLDPALTSQLIKVQYNQGGGCFPMHFDTEAALDLRRVTAVLYLNEEWQPQDGGELILYPFPYPKVVVPPVAGTVALFASAYVAHRTKPARKERFCVTTWMSSNYRRSPPQSQAIPFHRLTRPLRDVLIDKDTRRLLSQACLSDDWVESIKDAHHGEEQNTLLDLHSMYVNAVHQTVNQETLNNRIKDEMANIKLLEWF